MQLLRYALPWLLAGLAVAAALVLVLDDGERDGDVTLPPVEQIELSRAAVEADCTLRRALPGERLNPPVDGPRSDAPPPRPAAYPEPIPGTLLVAALRRGILVIHYRPGIEADELRTLRRIRAAVPRGTILVPNGTNMPYAVAITAYRRLLGCPRLDEPQIDALRLFRGRFIGLGPDV